jgi:hypothetical protein
LLHEIQFMPRKKPFRVKIHDFDHPPPHCHVYCSDGETLRITLLMLEELDGKRVKREIVEYITENLDALADEWDLKNPKKHPTT